MVKVNLLPSSIAATTAFAALSHVNVNFNTPLHVQAFSPAATTRAHRFASTTSSTHTHTHTRTQLASSVVDETAPSVSPDNASNDNTNGSNTDKDQVAAKAEPYKFIPSPNGKAGIMAIKLLEENMTLDFIAPIEVNAEVDIDKDGGDKEETIAPPTPEQPLQASSTGMFGGIASQAKINTPKRNTNKSQQGEDFVGKAVVFKDGRVGTVIAQRPPMAFVTCDFGEWDSEDAAGTGTGTDRKSVV